MSKGGQATSAHLLHLESALQIQQQLCSGGDRALFQISSSNSRAQLTPCCWQHPAQQSKQQRRRRQGVQFFSLQLKAHMWLMSAFSCCVLCAESVHKWNKDASDWGFTQFMPFVDAVNPEKGYLLNDTLKIKVEIQVQVRRITEDSQGGCQCCPTAVAAGSVRSTQLAGSVSVQEGWSGWRKSSCSWISCCNVQLAHCKIAQLAGGPFSSSNDAMVASDSFDS